MRNAKWFTCLLLTAVLGVAGVVKAQQLTINGQAPVDQSLQAAQEDQNSTSYSELPPHQLNHPAAPQLQDRSLLVNNELQPAQGIEPGQSEKQREAARGELGVWLAAMDGPGLAIRRVTEGSAAEQAGLRAGDVLMQVNDRWASSPRAAAEMIRAIPIGEAIKLQIWRDGQVQQLSATIAPIRQQEVAINSMDRDQEHQVGFRGDVAAANSDLSKRVMQLEQQLGMVTQELQRLREQLSQMRTGDATPVGNETRVVTPQEFVKPAETTTAPSDIIEPVDAPPTELAIEQPGDEATQLESDPAPATETDDDSLFK